MHRSPSRARIQGEPRLRRKGLVRGGGSPSIIPSLKVAIDSPSSCRMDAGPRSQLKAQAERRERLVGIALMCGAVLCFAGLDACAKWLNRSIDPVMTVWARYMASVLVVSALLNPWTVPGLLRTRRPWLQAGRSVLVLSSTILNFIALQYLQLTETVSIMFATPFVVALLAGPMLGEWIGPRRLAAIGVGFVGVLIITRPGLGGMHPAAFLCVAGAVCYALYGISTRILAAYDSSATTMFYSGLAGVILITPVLPLIWTTPSSALVWPIMLLMGAFGALGHWLLILAHARAPAPLLAPFIYTQIVWMLALGYLVFGDLPDHWTAIGACVVIASGLYLLYREQVRKAEVKSSA
jgi:drug/metabolite transporter (DMT)-like permease